MSILGGQPTTLCAVDARAYVSATWGPDDQIIFTHDAPEQHGRLLRVSAQGGTPDTLLATEADTYVDWPHILPGGRAVLITTFDDHESIDNARIVLQRLDGDGTETLITDATRPIYIATGHLIFARGGTLMAVPFDLERLVVTGPAVTLTEQVFTQQDGARAAFAVSSMGTLVYEPGGVSEQQRGLVWVDRSGIAAPLSVPDHDYWDPRLSPDGRRIALHTRATGTEIWVYDAVRGSAVRLTFSPGEDETPFWSPDGAWVAYSAQRTDPLRIIARVPADGSGEEDVLWSSTHHMHVESWSPDGETILFTDIDTESREDLWVLDLADRTARPLLQTPYSERMGRISPDGRWVAYTSDESGTDEIYIQAFPGLGRKTPVSTQGGRGPVWSPDGRELFYRGEGYLMAVPIEDGRPTAAAQPLFADSYQPGAANHIMYDVAGDGERFLMVENREGSRGSQLNVVLNWFEEVKARVAAAE